MYNIPDNCTHCANYICDTCILDTINYIDISLQSDDEDLDAELVYREVLRSESNMDDFYYTGYSDDEECSESAMTIEEYARQINAEYFSSMMEDSTNFTELYDDTNKRSFVSFMLQDRCNRIDQAIHSYTTYRFEYIC